MQGVLRKKGAYCPSMEPGSKLPGKNALQDKKKHSRSAMSTGGEESSMVMPTKADEDKAVKVSVTLYPEELAALAEEAKQRRLSRSTVLRMIVQDWIKTRRKTKAK